MIISRTPFRVSLFGGGTDYPTWFQQHGGAVLGTTINKYCYISVRELPPFFEYKHRMVYSRIENITKLEEIQHPAIRGVMQDFKWDGPGLEIHHDGDLPARSGLGSSSAFTVGLINALRAFQGKMSSAKRLGDEAIRIEQDVIGEAVGSQDQIWAAYGGTNVIQFMPDGTYQVTPIVMRPARRVELQSHMMLFFTGFSRIAAELAKAQIANMAKREANLHTMRRMVDDALEVLQSEGPIKQIGDMLHEGWMLKRDLAAGVTTSAVDEIYEEGRAAGAWGGKLLGAGGGGFILMFAPPERHQAIRQRLSKLVHVNIEIGSPGSRIVMYEPNGLDRV